MSKEVLKKEEFKHGGSCLGAGEKNLEKAIEKQREDMIVNCCSGTISDISECIEEVDKTIDRVIKRV